MVSPELPRGENKAVVRALQSPERFDSPSQAPPGRAARRFGRGLGTAVKCPREIRGDFEDRERRTRVAWCSKMSLLPMIEPQKIPRRLSAEAGLNKVPSTRSPGCC